MQIIIDKTISTHFDKMKLCAFIFACFKNESDCIIIEIPLNEMSPQMAEMVGEDWDESSFAPRVTSKIPNKKFLIVSGETKGIIFETKIEINSRIFKSSKASEIK